MAIPITPLPSLSENDIRRFLSRVDRRGLDECWPWNAGKNSDGYGIVRLSGRIFKAHRIAYFLGYGSDPGHLNILHNCDNPSCCNWNHAYPGTPLQNSQDRDKRGRGGCSHFRGTQLPQAKLSEDQVRTIRVLLAEKKTMRKDIAAMFGVSRQSVTDIKAGKHWAWLK